jgi:hypothetical protein
MSVRVARRHMRRPIHAWLLVALGLSSAALAQEQADLAKAAQNLVAAMNDRIGERAK